MKRGVTLDNMPCSEVVVGSFRTEHGASVRGEALTQAMHLDGGENLRRSVVRLASVSLDQETWQRLSVATKRNPLCKTVEHAPNHVLSPPSLISVRQLERQNGDLGMMGGKTLDVFEIAARDERKLEFEGGCDDESIDGVRRRHARRG